MVAIQPSGDVISDVLGGSVGHVNGGRGYLVVPRLSCCDQGFPAIEAIKELSLIHI